MQVVQHNHPVTTQSLAQSLLLLAAEVASLITQLQLLLVVPAVAVAVQTQPDIAVQQELQTKVIQAVMVLLNQVSALPVVVVALTLPEQTAQLQLPVMVEQV